MWDAMHRALEAAEVKHGQLVSSHGSGLGDFLALRVHILTVGVAR